MAKAVADEIDEKEKGNRCFKCGELADAVSHYTAALKKTPNNPVLYSNRSVSYLRLKNGSAALDDALACVRLDPRWNKAFFRVAEAMQFQQRWWEAKLYAFQGLELDPTNSSLIELHDLLFRKAITEYYNTSSEKPQAIQVKLIGGKHSKGVAALKKIDRLQTLLNEPPLVSHITIDEFDTFQCNTCSLCLRGVLLPKHLNSQFHSVTSLCYGSEIPALVECGGCAARYCSSSCCERAWNSYHKLLCTEVKKTFKGDLREENARNALCRYEQLCKTIRSTHAMVVARMLAISLLGIAENGFSLQKALQPWLIFESYSSPMKEDSVFVDLLRIAFGTRFLRFEHGDSSLVEELVTLGHFRILHGVLQRNSSTVHPISDVHLYVKDNYDKLKTPEGLINFCSMSFESVECLLASPQMQRLTATGTALFAVANSMNHSCCPNAALASSTNSNAITIIAMEELVEGQEVFISYIDEKADYKTRTVELQANYFFECDCKKCQQRL